MLETIVQTDANTPNRLLEAGRQVFARHGLTGSRTRDICALARANVAAVNYHFGSKEQLYIKVLVEHARQARERYPLDEGVAPQSSPEERLRAFVRGLFRQLMAEDSGEHAQLGKMILLELVQPSQHVESLIDEIIRPVNTLLRAIVSELLPGAPSCVVTRCAAGIMSQFALFRFDPRVLATLGPDFMPDEEHLLAVADAIAEFSLGGIQQLRAQHAAYSGSSLK
jgi:AcrR family transcriptional regulator